MANAGAILAQLEDLTEQHVAVAVFPELCLSGYSAEDLFFTEKLLGDCRQALALLAEILRHGLRRPRGVFCFSPLTDMTFSGDSMASNADAEVMLPVARAGELARMYLRESDPRDPRVSPLFAGFRGAPPVWIAAGDTEILLDDTRRMAARLRADGVRVTEVIARDLPHVWPIFGPLLPEACRTLEEVAGWIRSLSRPQGDS